MKRKDCVDARGNGLEDIGERKGGAAAKKDVGAYMKDRDAGKKGKGDDFHGKHGLKSRGEVDKVEVGAGKATSDGVPKEALKENAEGESGASGDGKRPAKRQRIGAFFLHFACGMYVCMRSSTAVVP